MTDPMESLARRVAEGVFDLLVNALDVNALMRRVDLNAALSQVDLDAILARVNVNRLLDRVDPNTLLDRVDLNALLNRADMLRFLALRADIGATRVPVPSAAGEASGASSGDG